MKRVLVRGRACALRLVLPIVLLAASAVLWGVGWQSARDEDRALDDEIARHFGAPFRFLPIEGAEAWAFTPDGGSVVAVSAGGDLSLHDIEGGADPLALATPGPVAALAAGRSWIAAAPRGSGALLLFDPAGGEPREFDPGIGRITALAFAYGGSVLAAGGESGWVALLDPATGEVEDRFAAGEGRVLDLAASGRLLAVLPSGGPARVYRDETRLETLEVWPGEGAAEEGAAEEGAAEEGATSIDLAAGSDWLAIAAHDRVVIHVLSKPTRLARVLSGFAFERAPVRFRPGSHELSTSGPGGRPVLWQLPGDTKP
ncbi:MAG: WD40 repeat domain-containing protein [Planctomycetes bacterium]|nr:WD40 repeat domain-containing protein [Planctomycetota bacterium]